MAVSVDRSYITAEIVFLWSGNIMKNTIIPLSEQFNFNFR